MDLASSIIGAIILAICIAPFIIMSTNRKKRERKALKTLQKIAQQHDCEITNYEIGDDFVIGIDEPKRIVFFNKKLKETVFEQHIKLADVQACKIKNISRTVSNQNGNYNVVEELDLCFVPIEKGKKEVLLEFYNAENSTQLSGELQAIEKWQSIINACMGNKKNR